MLTAHELRIEIYSKGCFFIKIWQWGASFLKDFLITLHWLSRASDSVQDFWGYQGLGWPFIEGWPVMRISEVLDTVRGEIGIVLSIWTRQWSWYESFWEPRFRPIYVFQWFECFLILTDWKHFFRLPLWISNTLFLLELCTLRSVSIFACDFLASKWALSRSLVS